MTPETTSIHDYDRWCRELEPRSSNAGSRRLHQLIRISEGIDANPICVAAIRMDGDRPGPRIWLQAQTHGDEPNPTAAILAVLAEISPEELCGTVVALPAMHSTAVRHFSREAPLDGKNGNRIWGIDWRSTGHTRVFSYIWMERVASAIERFQPDLVIDMHDGGVALQIVSHVLYDINQAAAIGAHGIAVEPLATASGMRVVWKYEGGRFGGSIGSHMNQLGFPSIMLESGGTGALVADDISEMADGLRNVLRAVGSIAESPQPRHERQLEMLGANWVRATQAGIFRPFKALGERVVEREPIGVVSDVFGDVREEVRSPADGLIFGLRHIATANMGDYIANIAQLAD